MKRVILGIALLWGTTTCRDGGDAPRLPKAPGHVAVSAAADTAVFLGGALRGAPSMFQGTFGSPGSPGNFELLVPYAGTPGFLEYFRANDQTGAPWIGPLVIDTTAASYLVAGTPMPPTGGVAFLERPGGTFDGAIVGKDGKVYAIERDTSGAWSLAMSGSSPVVLGANARGQPSIAHVQCGAQSLLFVAYARGATTSSSPGIGVASRDADAQPSSWQTGDGIDDAVAYDSVTMFVSDYGNLELVARTGDRLASFWAPPCAGSLS